MNNSNRYGKGKLKATLEDTLIYSFEKEGFMLMCEVGETEVQRYKISYS